MKNIKIEYSYDGSEFFGFQRQPNVKTVQGEIEKVLKIIFKSRIDLISSGRTDRGVHAKKQISNFYTNLNIPVEKIKKILNDSLPQDIVIGKVEEVELDFNSRFSATYRSYEYYLTNEKSPFSSRYKTYIDSFLDIELLNKIINPIVGVHDFSNFRLSDCGSQTTIREIYEAYFEKIDERTIKLSVKGNAFLKSQIRIIVGTVLEIYFKKKSAKYLIDMLENPSLDYPRIVAKPNGLYLSDIGYEVKK